MKVSAVLAVYNGETYLAEALDSMLAELRPGDQLIVVDDGSTDGTADVLDRFRGRIVTERQPNSGTAAALNRAIALSSGDVLGFNDADDLWTPGRLPLLLQALIDHPDVELFFGHSRQFVSPELSEEEHRRFAPPVEVLRGATFPSLLLRRSTFERVGAFDPESRVNYAYAWLGQASGLGIKSMVIDEVVSDRRLHPNNWTRRNKTALQRDALKELRNQLVQRRNAARDAQT